MHSRFSQFLIQNNIQCFFYYKEDFSSPELLKMKMEDFELCHTFRIIVKLIYYLFSRRPFLPSYIMRLESHSFDAVVGCLSNLHVSSMKLPVN